MLEKIKSFKCSEVEIEYLLTGEENDETVMFVHGGGANLRQFLPQHLYFSKEYRVLSVSLRGHGNSTKANRHNVTEYTLEKHRDDILELLEYLNIRNVHYIGNSAGGLVGYELVNKSPQLFKSFVTFGTTAELKYSKLLVNLIVAIDKIMMKINPSGYSRFMAKHVSQYDNVQKEMYDAFMMSREVSPLFRKNIGNYSYLETIENMKIPFLLVQGENDKDINNTLQSTTEVIKNNPKASIIKLADAGHIANLDNPEEFNNIIETFIKS